MNHKTHIIKFFRKKNDENKGFSILCQKNQGGFTIIEIIASVSVLLFGVLGVYAFFFPSFNITYNVANKLTAIYLAQEGLEVARNIRDNNFMKSVNDPNVEWSDGLIECELGCQLDYKTKTLAEAPANQLKDFNPSEFLMAEPDTGNLYGYDSGINTKFQRKITVTRESGMDVLKVFVLVTWDYKGETHSFETGEYLYNWY